MASIAASLRTPRGIVTAAIVLLIALLPLYSPLLEQADLISARFALTVMTRVLILATAAISLNLILGYGGMVSFGHAVYIGIGGYSVGILVHHGVYDGFLHFPIAIGLSALFALAIGALSLRTRGVYFIMITLAFSQLVYYVGVGLEAYGADDGLTIQRRSDFAGLIVTRGPEKFVWFYEFSVAVLLLVLFFMHRLVNSRFGMVLQGSRSNESRMQALGYPTFRYRLVAFAIAGGVCGLAGAMLANHTEFISPSMMHWTRSGDLIVIVVLGGMGSLFGPLYGAIAFLLLEEFLPGVLKLLFGAAHGLADAVLGERAGPLESWLLLSEYWQIALGVILILVVLYARGGIDSLLGRRR